ncbi:MAG: hypothetical protein FWD71_10360 [Oscillospiraceae bacterium]|nr:hypothetical protein [Oscillospiraceae bacterium]
MIKSIFDQTVNWEELSKKANLNNLDYDAEVREYYILLKKMKKSMTENGIYNLEELIKHHSRMQAMNDQFYFKQGFKMAAQLLLESSESSDEQIYKALKYDDVRFYDYE